MRGFRNRWIGWLVLLVAFLGLGTPIVHGASSQKSYAINVILPSTQMNSQLQYWQLKLPPKTEQTLQTQVINTGKEKITVRVQANNATTSTNAVVIYSSTQKDIYPRAAVSFASLIQGPRTQSVTLDPKQSKIVTFKLKTPSKDYDGVILGGIYTVATVSPADAQIRTEVAYKKSVVLQGKDMNVEPTVKFGQVQPVVQAGKLALALPATNNKAMYADGVTTDLTVTNRTTGKKVFHSAGVDLKFAPNSQWQWTFPIKNLPGGDYHLRLVTAGRILKRQVVNQDFSITGAQTSQMNAYNTSHQDQMKLVWIVIGILVVVLLVATWVYLYYRSRNRAIKRRTK